MGTSVWSFPLWPTGKFYLQENTNYQYILSCGWLVIGLAGIGEIANISNAERQRPNAERQKFWTDRSVVWILIFLESFEKISSADFIAKNLKKISSVEFIDADCIEKKFALLISLKKISQTPNPKTTDRSFLNPKPRFSRTDRSFLSSFPTRIILLLLQASPFLQ